MLTIVITSPDVRAMSGVGPKGPWEMRMQSAYIYPVDADGVIAELPDKFDLMLDREGKAGDANAKWQAPYPRGKYQLHPSSVSLDFNGRLVVRPRLVPLVTSKT